MSTILQVAACPFPWTQGSQVYIAGLCGALVRAGHEVTLAAYGQEGEGKWPVGVQPLLVPVPAMLRVDRSGPTMGKPLLDLALAARVAQHVRRHRVDVVHAHNVEAPFVAWLAQGLAGRRVPIVYNLHTALAEELPVYGPGWVAPAARAVGQGVDRWLARHADACLAISDRGAELLRAHGARRVVLSPPGVDVDELNQGRAEHAVARLGLGGGRWVAYTGNADPYQDLDVLFAAMARLPHIGLVVVGPSPEDEVRRAALAAGLPPERLAVLVSGALTDALDVLAACGLAVVPRAVCAGFPIKLLNSLGAGCATIVAEGSAQPIDGIFVVPNHDPTALAEAISRAVADVDGTRRRGLRGAAAVAAGWSWDQAVTPVSGLYRALQIR